MARRPKTPARSREAENSPLETRLDEALSALRKAGSEEFREQLRTRFGIVAAQSYGVSMADVQAVGKRVGPDHELADQLWRTGVYEARLLASVVDEPDRVTSAQMDRWAREFENWADCDTVCFKLFDRSPHAFGKVPKWAKSRREMTKRAAFALAASLALHRKDAADEDFVAILPIIEREATDERNFVKKGVSWALRAIGSRKSPALRARARELARRLAESDDAAARWVGKDALREFARKDRARKG